VTRLHGGEEGWLSPAIIGTVARSHDVIVIGAGIIGCAIGRELARRGAAVRIFEARTVGAGATRASAGVLAPYIEAHDSAPLLALTVRSLGLYDAFVEAASAESGIAVEYRRCGTLEIAADPASGERLKRSAAHHGADVMRWIDATTVRTLEPALTESVHGALHVARHGYVAVPALTDALVWAALRHGAQLEAGHRVTGVRTSGSGFSVLTEDGTTWTAGHVVVAAGSWSGMIGIAAAAPAPVHPIRGQLLHLRWDGRAPSHIIWGPDCYVVPWENGTVLVGATVEDVGFDERATAAGVHRLLTAVCELLPHAARASFSEVRSGLRPATADGLPYIGRSPNVPGVIYATGHYRNGILLAPLTALLIGDLVIDSREDPMLATVRPGRSN
jgi:glycine oxidase